MPTDIELDKTEWTQRDLDLLHELIRDAPALRDMVRDYDRARWLRGQMKWWGLWILGLPAGVVTTLTIWDRIAALIKGPH